MDYLAGLNPQQRRAVEHTTGPMLVVAGAGTGKTQVITRRIARLTSENTAKPEQILALTFTEKAAREMQDRLYELIGYQAFSVAVMTFNAFGAELLGRYAYHIGRSTRGGLINDTQKALLLKQRLDQINLQYYGLQADIFGFLQGIVDYIGRLQNAGVSAADYQAFVDQLRPSAEGYHAADIKEQHDLAALYSLYEHVKAETGTYDYYDQLALPLAILRERPNLVERLQRQYRYILVDEYQDTSPIQDALLRLLAPPDGNLFAVGDDDQAIYSFRGADLQNILDFTEHFRVPEPIVLVQNYRSGQPILDAAYRLIGHNNPERLEAKLGLSKRLEAQDATAEVRFTPYLTASDEQTAVVAAIAERRGSGEATAEVAVLARSNATLRSYAKALRAAGVPFAMSTEVNIFEQRELIGLWYLLQWINCGASDEAIAHILLGPYVGWEAAHWQRVVQIMRDGLCDGESALGKLAETDGQAKGILTSLARWREWAAQESVTGVVVKLISDATGEALPLVERLKQRALDEPEQERRVMRVFEDLNRLLGQMQDFESVATDTTLGGYLATFPVPPTIEVAETEGETGGVQLLTVHASKGLEFETVYLVNCTARAWSPGASMGLAVPPELSAEATLPAEHEERRLLYVAVTRAKRNLYVSSPTASAAGTRQKVSPLVEELFGQLPSQEIVKTTGNIENSLQKIQRYYPLQHELPDRLPFETADGWIELGVNDLHQFEQYPHEFYLQKVLKISQPFGPQLAFGVVVHGVIQAYYEAKLRGETPVAAELAARLDELWSDRGYETKQLAETAHRRAHETLVRFMAREQGLERRIEAAELPIRLEIAEAKLRLRGRIDATFQTEAGLEVRDFKTGNQTDAEKLAKDAKDSFQLRSYALAIEQLTGQAPAVVTLDYVVTGMEGSAELTPKLLGNFRSKLVTLADKLRAREFHPGAPSLFNQGAAFRYYGSDEEQ